MRASIKTIYLLLYLSFIRNLSTVDIYFSKEEAKSYITYDKTLINFNVKSETLKSVFMVKSIYRLYMSSRKSSGNSKHTNLTHLHNLAICFMS